MVHVLLSHECPAPGWFSQGLARASGVLRRYTPATGQWATVRDPHEEALLRARLAALSAQVRKARNAQYSAYLLRGLDGEDSVVRSGVAKGTGFKCATAQLAVILGVYRSLSREAGRTIADAPQVPPTPEGDPLLEDGVPLNALAEAIVTRAETRLGAQEVLRFLATDPKKGPSSSQGPLTAGAVLVASKRNKALLRWLYTLLSHGKEVLCRELRTWMEREERVFSNYM